MSHTPGKWIAECYGMGGAFDNPIDLYEILADGQTRVCEAALEDDARLIAAAPELLAMLKEFVHPYQTGTLTESERNEKAHAAIAKAEGK